VLAATARLGKSTLPKVRPTRVVARCKHVETKNCSFIHVVEQETNGAPWVCTMKMLHTCASLELAHSVMRFDHLVSIILQSVECNDIEWCATVSAQDVKGVLGGFFREKGKNSIVSRIRVHTLQRVAKAVREKKLGSGYEVPPPFHS
jgi:hypothetical protein